jgi:hypothetical protein
MLNSIGLPYAYYQFPDNTEQPPPFICFYYDSSRDLMADNKNYQKIERLVVELYTKEKDFSTEATVESTLTSNGLTYSRAEQFLDDQHMMVEVYDIDVLITEDNDG